MLNISLFGNPPLEQLSACSTVKCYPQTQWEGRFWGRQSYRRQRASLKALITMLCDWQGCYLAWGIPFSEHTPTVFLRLFDSCSFNSPLLFCPPSASGIFALFLAHTSMYVCIRSSIKLTVVLRSTRSWWTGRSLFRMDLRYPWQDGSCLVFLSGLRRLAMLEVVWDKYVHQLAKPCVKAENALCGWVVPIEESRLISSTQVYIGRRFPGKTAFQLLSRGRYTDFNVSKHLIRFPIFHHKPRFGSIS